MFSWSRPITLASAARVCKNWLFSARRRLYRQVVVDNLRMPSAMLLHRTLSAGHHLHSFVHRLWLRHASFGELHVDLFDWLWLLPEHSVQSVELRIMDTSPEISARAVLSILDIPAIRTTPQLIINCRLFLTPERLCRVFGMSHLDTLSIAIPNATATLQCGLTTFPKLRKLVIHTEGYSPLVEEILQGLPSPLQSFGLCAENLEADDIVSLRKGLERHAPHLRYLSLLGNCFSRLCFMDEYIGSFPFLEVFLCAPQIHTPQIFSRLPPTLLSLSLATPRAWHGPALAIEYTAAFQHHRNRLHRLNTLTILDYGYPRQNWGPLRRVCMAEGIAYVEWDEGRYSNIIR